MAKVPFNKLNLKVNNDIIPIHIGDQVINVKQYLPIEDKLALIAQVIENAHDIDNNFSNPLKVDVYTCLEIVDAYTDISFTEKQKEDAPGTYDKIISSGIWTMIHQAIPTHEYDGLVVAIQDTIKAYYAYRNSILGILDNIQTDYSDLNLDLNSIKDKISDPQTLTFIKDLLTKVN